MGKPFLFMMRCWLIVFCAIGWSAVWSQTAGDSLPYPLRDRRTDGYTSPNRNPFDLKDPSNIKKTIEYDPNTRQYFIVEKIGTQYYRTPTYMTFEEYLRFKSLEQERDYFQKRSNTLSGLNKKLVKPKLTVGENLFNRMFGNGKVEVRPQGNVDVTMGYQGQKINNPALPERARRNGGFDFDMAANLNVIANIGDKLKLPISYNTLANFDFENQLKLDYAGGADEIIKRIEAGNVNFTTKGSLIPGAQSLFGIKTQLQFGRLFITGVLANQRATRQTLGLQGGSANTLFEFKANDYEENRHFLLAQYFRNTYNLAMSSLPAVRSQVQILRVEVWVTNRNGSTTETRDIVALQDLAEKAPFNYPATPGVIDFPFNDANRLYRDIINDPTSRSPSQITGKLSSLGLQPVQDFEKTFARKLNNSEYTFNPQVGFLSLNQPLQPDEVMGVAYQYTYNGRTYQVGEFSQDVPPDTTAATAIQKVLFLKLLKATSQRTQLPIWNLMMKNVYALRARDGGFIANVQPADFQLNVLYEEPSLGLKRYLPEGPKSGFPIITLLNLDRLNNQNDPQPDGIFDYIEGYTMISNQARVIFPLLEPFGRDLDSVAFAGATQELKDKYVYYPLYDTIKEIAKTYANLDRFVISGQAKGTATSDISLGAFNVPPGSVTVTSGGRTLVEGVDYVVDYNLGSVKVINPAILNAGLPVNVQFENNAGFGMQQRNYMGLRAEYQLFNTPTKSLNVGGTLVRLGERPFFTKMVYNEDPIRNTMFGLDANYRSEFPKLTRLLDKLPFYTTNEMSTINAYGEAAWLKPGHPPQIGKGAAGLIYIDDFEGTRSNIDLRFPLVSWTLASTPANNGLFPEANLRDSLASGFNRAKLAWYNIEPNLQAPRAQNNPVAGQPLGDPRWRAISQRELFPQRTVDFGQAQLVTFDMSFYPTDRGPYNYDARFGSVTANGKLLNPKQRWGGVMRGLDQIDFETGNIEYIEFWLQDPFLKNPGSSGGQLYFNLGNISEDVAKDGKRFFENGLPTPNIPAEVDANTKWGRVPLNPIQVTNAFSNDPADRPFQDVGFDGLQDSSESVKFASYLNQLLTNFGTTSPAYINARVDPSNDNFRNYRDASYDAINANILQRYKNVNNPHGNSPVANSNDNLTSAFTLYPDQEDLNRDNTLNELEEYFQYKVDLRPGSLVVGRNYITDIRKVIPDQKLDGAVPEENWYLFRIPISDYEKKVGNIPDFKSIRFIRMYFNGFEDSITARFAKLELVRNQWRSFTFQIDTTGQYKPVPNNSGTSMNVLAVNLEENSARQPIRYVIPPGIERVQQLSNNNVNLLQNEQSISLQVCNLFDRESRGVFKTVNLDLRQYRQMKMFVHAESVRGNQPLRDGDIAAVIRFGNDFVSNYYEVRVPLKITPFGATIDTAIWPTENLIDFAMQRLIDLKVKRNLSSPSNRYYKETDADGRSFAILGNPNLGEVRGMFIGVQNNRLESICTEVWFNELRLSDIDEEGGMAATGRVDVKLADLGTVSVSASTRGIGFGALEARANDRSREELGQFDAATNLELGKLFPRKAYLSIPFFAGYSRAVSTPEYDPYDLDVKLKNKISAIGGSAGDSIRQDAIDIRTLSSFSFNNVRKLPRPGKKVKPWSIENFDFSYAYSKEARQNPLIETNETRKYRGGLGYSYAGTPKYWTPFSKSIRSKSPWLAIIKDINFNPNPELLSFRADVNRHFNVFRPRNVGGPKGVLPETYFKFFTFDRFYNLRWGLTRSFVVDFMANNRARVDEDSGRLNRDQRHDMWNNFWRGGRTTTYDHTLNLTYTLPTGKIPALDWTNVRLGYIAKYNWLTSSQEAFAKSLGNFVGNGQDKNVTAELDFTRLYAKSRWLRAVDFDAPPPVKTQQAAAPAPAASDTSGKKGKKPKVKKDPNELPEVNTAIKVLARILTSVKRISLQYGEMGTTALAGYMDSTQVLGNNLRSNAPGFDFAFGKQPDTGYINRWANRGLFTKNPLFNNLNRQDYNQRLNITAQLIPVRDLLIDVNLEKTFGKNYTELFKDTLGTPGSQHVRLSPYTSGTLNMTFISFGTLFDDFKPNEVSATFKQFEANRTVISRRLGEKNPYTGGQVGSDGYYKGYGRYAQNVLIPAFISAYTGKDPENVALVKEDNGSIRSNPFSGYLPRPNWNVTYTGLSRIPGMEKYFTNFTLAHGYNSRLMMNSFNSALFFADPLGFNVPGFIDTLTGNYVPFFLVPNITILEAFAPLLRLNMDFTNQLTANVEYKKSRMLSLSLVDFQLAETRSEEFVVGIGWRKRGFPLPFKVRLPGQKDKSKQLENDINFRLDFSIRDDATSNSRLDQDAALPTAGQKVVTISPSIDYVLNNRINVKLFFDQRRTEPKISTSPPITFTRAGVQIRISLTQ